MKPLKTRTKYKIVGGDFSSQEPRMMAYMSKCEKMKQIFRDKKDIYAFMAQEMYNNNYEDNLQFYPEGTKIIVNGEEITCGKKTHIYEEGNARRKNAKVMQLALCYGMGAKSVGDKINKTKEEGQALMDRFFTGFKELKDWIDYNNAFVKDNEYVEDFLGRRRHLPEINLPKFDVEPTDETKKNSFNPFLDCDDVSPYYIEVKNYLKSLENTRFKYKDVEEFVKSKGYRLIDNSSKIASARRQTTNSIIQGSAATLTKIAMNEIFRDKELNDLGFRLLITVHDEVLGECPEINAERVAVRLKEVMIGSAAKYIDVPMDCDMSIVTSWYEDELDGEIQKEIRKLIKTMSIDDAYEVIRKEHTELSEDQFNRIVLHK